MSKRVKKVYKCIECETMITIVTKVHDLPESIICPCDNVAESKWFNWKSLIIKCLNIKLKEQPKIKKEFKQSLIYQNLSASRLS